MAYNPLPPPVGVSRAAALPAVLRNQTAGCLLQDSSAVYARPECPGVPVAAMARAPTGASGVWSCACADASIEDSPAGAVASSLLSVTAGRLQAVVQVVQGLTGVAATFLEDAAAQEAALLLEAVQRVRAVGCGQQHESEGVTSELRVAERPLCV